jgi:hypothetical protein
VSLPRRREKVDPARRIKQRHAKDLKRIEFYSDEIDRMTAIVEQRKFSLATVRHASEKLDEELHELSVKTSTALAGNALDEVQAKVDRTSEQLRAKLEKKNLERTQAADREETTQKELKRQIDETRKARLHMRAAVSQLRNELENSKAQIKRHLNDLMEAQQERLQTEAHVLALKQMLEGVDHTFAAEWSSLTTRIDKERAEIEEVQLVSAAASSARNWQDEVGRDGTILKAVKEHDSKEQERESLVLEKQLEAKQAALTFQEQQRQLSAYQEAVAVLHRRLDVGSAEDLVKAFEESEQLIFGLMRQVVEATAEAEALEAKSRAIASKLVHARERDLSRRETLAQARAAIVHKKQTLERSISEMDANASVLSELQQSIATGTRSLYALLACDELVPAAGTLGESELTMANMESYLGVLEQRVGELVLLANAQARETRDKALVASRAASPVQPGHQSPLRPTTPVNLSSSSSSSSDGEDEDEEGEVGGIARHRERDADADEMADLLAHELDESARKAKLAKEVQRIKEEALKKRIQREQHQRATEDHLVVGPSSPLRTAFERRLHVDLSELTQHLSLLDKQEQQEHQRKDISRRSQMSRRRPRVSSTGSVDSWASAQKPLLAEEEEGEPGVMPLSREELLRNITARYS